jgi:hypothetical protein
MKRPVEVVGPPTAELFLFTLLFIYLFYFIYNFEFVLVWVVNCLLIWADFVLMITGFVMVMMQDLGFVLCL